MPRAFQGIPTRWADGRPATPSSGIQADPGRRERAVRALAGGQPLRHDRVDVAAVGNLGTGLMLSRKASSARSELVMSMAALVR